jgi:N-formylglutamate amidohydrolase
MNASAYPGWVVLHVPHDSDYIPPSVLSQFVLDEAALRREAIRMTDHRTFDLFRADRCQGRYARAGASRLVVDVERFADDAQEPMSGRGMGVIYTRTSDQQPLRRALSKAERSALLEAFYFPHHARLQALVDQSLKQWGRCLVLDCHSFPSRPLPYEHAQDTRRPDVCIGTDSFHTPKCLEDAFVTAFSAAGFSVAVNTPFAGALVPSRHYRRDDRVAAIMVEVNRRLYLDEESGVALPTFDQIAERIAGLCQLACG